MDSGFCRDEQQNLEKERIAGTTDYDELVAGNGIVLLQERADLYDIEAALGDTVEVDYKTEYRPNLQQRPNTVIGHCKRIFLLRLLKMLCASGAVYE